jgi:hypothetical protein
MVMTKQAHYYDSDLGLKKHLDPKYLKCHKNNPQKENGIKQKFCKKNNHKYVQLKIIQMNLISIQSGLV